MSYSYKKAEVIETVTLIPEEGATPSLLEVLSYRRGYDTKGEKLFIKKHIRPLKDSEHEYHEDGFGNILVVVGDEPPAILHNAHTDSCHSGRNSEIYQSLAICEDGMVRLLDEAVPRKSTLPDTKTKGKTKHKVKKEERVHSLFGEVLGADDGTGMYLMLHMIDAKVPGYYLFTRAEEVGGQGVKFIIKDKSDHALLNFLPEYPELVISYDRKDYGSIITEQMCGVCMGDDASALFASKLLTASLDWVENEEFTGIFKADPTGSYTDSAEFVGRAKHCTNLSVGYFDQHSPRESQHLQFAEDLLTTLINLDWYDLEFLLFHLTDEPEDNSWGNEWYSNYQGNSYNGYGTTDKDILDVEVEVEVEEEVIVTDSYLQKLLEASPYCQYCVNAENASFNNADCQACGGLEEAEDILYTQERSLLVEDLFPQDEDSLPAFDKTDDKEDK